MKIFQKSFLVVLITLCVTSIFIKTLKAEDEEYLVADVSSGQIEKLEGFTNYWYANSFYNTNKDNYDNLVLYHNDKVIRMEYGVVEFISNSSCSLNIAYRSLINKNTTSINACYGVDGAYIKTSDDGNYVYFMLSGDYGSTEIEDVTLHPYELLENRLSVYGNMNGSFVHKVKTQFKNDYYSTVIEIDDELDYLKDNKDYYSYDGHYFYRDFKQMIDDYRNNEYTNAINSDKPYYNYYQYLPFRSISNYSEEELNDYYENTLMITGKIDYFDNQNNDGANDVVNKSQLYGELNSFIKYQNIYGTNALLSLAVAINDSYNGKSYSSFVDNNVFAYNGYGNDQERNDERYISIDSSIMSFTRYILSYKYGNYDAINYSGLFLGNKASGLNQYYTNDMYWSEKVSSYCHKIDKTLGEKDLNQYCVGMINNRLDLYDDEYLIGYNTSIVGLNNYSFIILDELEKSYLIQIDKASGETGEYDFEKCIAYISKEDISLLTDKLLMHKTIVEDISEEKENDVEEIEVISFNTTCKINEYLDLRDCKLKVKYSDGKKETIPINTNMISTFDNTQVGKVNLEIHYGGLSTNVEIEVSDETQKLKENISNLIIKVMDSYKINGTYNKGNIKKIKLSLENIDYKYDVDTIRELDAILLNEYRDKANYVISDNKYDLSISGLTLSLADVNITKWFKPFTDTYYINIGNVSKNDKEKLRDIGLAYGFNEVDSLSLSYTLNTNPIDQSGAVIVSIKIPDKQSDKIYTVYRLDDNGDIVKCQTSQSDNYIVFLTKKSGNFMIYEKDSVNSYHGEDYKENISAINIDPDNHYIFIISSLTIALIILGCVCIVKYYDIENKRKILWKDYKKSLLKAVSVQEEKPKN